MMDQLLQRAAELRPGLQDLLASYISSNIVQGAVLEVDRYWFDSYLLWLYGPFAPPPFLDLEFWIARNNLYDPIEWDFNFRPSQWDSHASVMGYPEGSGPLIIRVILNASSEHTVGINVDTGNSFPQAFNGYPLIYETRPPLEALSLFEVFHQVYEGMHFHPGSDSDGLHGLSVGRANPAPTAGTLGGFLRSPRTDKRYLVSCAHVLGGNGTHVYTPGPYEDRGMNEVGIVRVSEIPSLEQLGQPCNMQAIPNAGRLDVAVAEILPGAQLADLPKVSAIRFVRNMISYQRVSFVGKVSGHVSAYIGGCTIWYQIKFPDGSRCFGELFEIIAPNGARRPLARGGDSGAWIEDNPASSPCWNGMLIAALPGGDRAYCCFAQYILEACKNVFPDGLALIP